LRPELRTPSPWRSLLEGRLLGELPRIAFAFPDLLREPRGSGQPVLVIPGYLTGDASTLPLRSYLALLGYRPHGWRLGLNRGDVPALVRELVWRTETLAERAGQRVALVGWSLGGYLAREVGRERPELVERIVTLGSPVFGGPKYTTVGGLFERLTGVDVDEIEAAVAEREAVAIRVPITAIYSRRDGIVAWEACIDPNPDVEHVELRTTHLGFGISPEAYAVIARRLARRRD
jgi:pimeloyl-ACP methyl ester carboxylesterase